METNLKFPLFISIILHIVFFVSIPAFKAKRPIQITFPVELLRVTQVQEEVQTQPVEKKEEKEVIPVKKIVKKKEMKKEVKEEEKKQEKPVDEKPVTAVNPVSSVSLENEFPFTWYLDQVRRKVSQNWNYNRESGNLRTVIYFRIFRDGSISKPKIDEPSGNSFYDQIALRAIELSSPFSRLPEAYEKEYLGVYFEFRFH